MRGHKQNTLKLGVTVMDEAGQVHYNDAKFEGVLFMAKHDCLWCTQQANPLFNFLYHEHSFYHKISVYVFCSAVER
jgi:hypothetical protein